jgi:hypothetical protein
MSRSIDLFIESAKPAQEVAEQIEQLTGLKLTAGGEPGTWSLQESGVHAELSANHYIDDAELPFGRYGYVLSARPASDVRLADAPEAALLRTVSEGLHRGGVATMLVHDLQHHDRVSAGAPQGSPQAPSVPESEGTPA